MIRILFIFLLLILIHIALHAQVPASEIPVTSSTEQELENITESNEDQETEDDTYLQLLAQLQKNPADINRIDGNFLKEMRMLNGLQVQNFITYRSLLGKFISLYELQAIPGWDVSTIQKFIPFVTITNALSFKEDFSNRLHKGDHTILIRTTQVLEKSKGYLVDPASGKNHYPGSPQRLFVRYKYIYKNLLQYGVVGEKDPGEQFFKGTQSKGFDYYSAHFFVRNVGKIKALALGDFSVNMGQGLTQWMSLAFKKGPNITALKRQSPVLKPYNSSGEIFFHRGAGITMGNKNWEATVFASLRKVDANFNADTASSQDEFISSLQTTGLHRTKNETDDRGSQQQIAFGGNIAYRFKKIHFGLNGIQYKLKFPLRKAADAYNIYALKGRSFGNYSVDYGYTYKNIHFFGEAAITDRQYPASVNGLLISVANNVDMSFLYRNISKGYQSLYTNAFTESSTPNNEKGFFTGISIRPSSSWRIDAYADIYRFPFLKYRINAPSEGKDYMVQINYKPDRQFEMYTRFKAESKSINYNPAAVTLSPVASQPKQNWRTHLSYRINPIYTIRSRVEIVWFDKQGPAEEEGFLLYTDLLYKPLLKSFSANARIQYFETGGYSSRLYAYENDVLYSYSIPVFYDKGFRYYINANYDFSKRVSVWAKWAQFIYPDKNSIGSGLDEIKKSHKSEVKLELLVRL